MKQYKLLFCTLLMSLGLFAQKDLSIEFETGGNYFNTETADKPYLRRDMVYYNTDQYNQSIASRFGMYFGGVKVQMQAINKQWRFSSGVRFIQTYSDLSKNTSPDYFYFIYQQTANSLEYLA